MTVHRQAILDMLGDDEVTFFEPPGMDAAIIGLSEYAPGRPRCVVYAYHKLIKYFTAGGMNYDEAVEWMAFNVTGAWVGPTTPIVVVSKETK